MKKKIFFIIPNLSGGGAQRVFLNLTNALNKSNYDVHLIYLSNKNKVFNVPQSVQEVNLNTERVRKAPLKILKLIKKEKPDLVVSTLGHLNLQLLLLKTFFPRQTKLVVRLTNIPSMNLDNNPVKQYIQKKLYKLYKRSDKVICQSEMMKCDVLKYSGMMKERTEKIFNPVDINSITKKSYDSLNNDFLIKQEKSVFFAGRLNKVKRVPLIIDAFDKYLESNSQSRLYILGEGPEKGNLQKYVNDKKLKDFVVFLGFQENIYEWLRHADLFIMASKHEGMPNALIESIALKIPVLVLKHPGGTIDIMKSLNLEDRFVDDLVITETSFKGYDINIIDRLEASFGVQNITNKYESVFQSVIEGE